MIRIKEKPANKLFEDGPDWVWEDNLKYWYCEMEDGLKAVIWAEWLNHPSKDGKQRKLSKSDEVQKIEWDGVCFGIRGGPDPSPKQGPILAWLRSNIETYRSVKKGLEDAAAGRLGPPLDLAALPPADIVLEVTPDQFEALKRLKALGQRLSSGSAWKTLLATRWGKDPETGAPFLEEEYVLDTGDLKALAALETPEVFGR